MSRSLYECSHALVKNGCIICDKGHRLPIRTLKPLERGAPLTFKICLKCTDFSRIGRRIAPADRGWNHDNG